MARVRVWDLPTRIVHWLFVALLPLSWWTAEERRLDWHRYCGFVLLGLIVFRLYWGLVGSSTARFARFVRGPRALVGYLRGAWTPEVGHNPLGALSVVALLALLATQVTLGLFTEDTDGLEPGPLASLVSGRTARAAGAWHADVFNVLMAFIALHIVAIAWYRLVRKQPLVAAMVHGRRELTESTAPMQPATLARFIVGVVLAAAAVWTIARVS